MGLALPKLRWLVIGAIAAGVWVMREDMQGPRPPERVPTRIERIVEAKPRPPKSLAAKPAVAKPAAKTTERPVPPKPVAGKPALQKAAVEKAPKTVSEKTALALPKSVSRPPSKPEKIVTGSISRPDKPTFVQTKAKVFMRAQAKADALIIATLRSRTVMRELARSGEWRLVMGDGQKGWVRADYLVKPTFLPRRPKLPVAEVKQAKASAKPAKAQ
jgi:hypothetical protein